MCKELEQLIEEARRYKMTEEEREAQVRSFAYGNTHLENETITRDDVQRAAETLSPTVELIHF